MGLGIAASVSGCARPSEPPAAISESSVLPSPEGDSELKTATGHDPQPTLASTPILAPLICRDAWGALPARPGGIVHTPHRMTIHHTAVNLGSNSNAPSRLRQHQTYHQESKGWIDIAYHIGVDRNGNIFELRRPEIVGDTATNYDPAGHFLVVCEGNFDEEPVTEAQIHGAALAFAWAAQRFSIPTDTLGGHRDASPDTACPGENLYAHVTSRDLRRRVDDLIAHGTVELYPTCGPEAAAVVAEIEAGLR